MIVFFLFFSKRRKSWKWFFKLTWVYNWYMTYTHFSFVFQKWHDTDRPDHLVCQNSGSLNSPLSASFPCLPLPHPSLRRGSPVQAQQTLCLCSWFHPASAASLCMGLNGNNGEEKMVQSRPPCTKHPSFYHSW